MSSYLSGARVTIPEGNWVVFGSDWGRVLSDTPTALVAEVEIEPSGRVRQDVRTTTTSATSILSETGAVMPIPAGTDLTIPAGTNVVAQGSGSKTDRSAAPSTGAKFLWILGAVALGVTTSYIGSMLVVRRLGARRGV